MFIVDPEFADAVSAHKWYLSRGGYYHRNVLKGQEGPRRLHRYIWWLKYGDVPPILDHINRVKWDNRLENLRPASATLNAQNMTTKRGGVRYDPRPYGPNHWEASIGWRGKGIYLGLFPTEAEARAYYDDCKARILAYEEAISRGEVAAPPLIERRLQTSERRGRPRGRRAGVYSPRHLAHSKRPWIAMICFLYKTTYLGCFATEKEAREQYDRCLALAKAYDEARSRGENPPPPDFPVSRVRKPYAPRKAPGSALAG